MRAFLLFIALLSAGPAVAQDRTPHQGEEFLIEEAGSHTLVRGRLLHLSADSVTVTLAREQRQFRLDDVLSIKRRGDSLKNGALLGALVGGAWCLVVCGQGLDTPATVPLAVLASGGLGVLIGAGIDAAVPGYTTLYRRPGQGSTAAREMLSVRWRF